MEEDRQKEPLNGTGEPDGAEQNTGEQDNSSETEEGYPEASAAEEQEACPAGQAADGQEADGQETDGQAADGQEADGQVSDKENGKKTASRRSFRSFAAGALAMLLVVVLVQGYIFIPLGRFGAIDIALPTYDLFSDPEDVNLLGVQRKLHEIQELLKGSYYYKRDAKTIEDGIFKGMIYGLTEDDYAAYYPVKVNEERTMEMEGSYVGLGITVSTDKETGYVLVSETLPEGPAYAAGIREGDLIMEADGVSLKGMALSEATSEHLKGKEGSQVTLLVLREGKTLTILCERRKIARVTVRTTLLKEENLGYIYISQFDGSTPTPFAGAIDEFEEMGVEGIIFDLRSNPGGDMDLCLEMADYCIPDDQKIYKENGGVFGTGSLMLGVEYAGGQTDYYYARDGHSVEIPMVVLVNGNSASAAEIFAGILQDYGSRVVGTKTFGKGIVQSVYNLSDGSGVKFTSARYLLPAGEYIHGKGLEPDVTAEPDEKLNEKGFNALKPDPEADNMLKVAVGLLKN